MESHARVVVIGGGATGCSLLYHLAKLGWTDSVLLEREELTAGSTWHAAGNCARFSHNLTLLRIRDYSIRLYQEIEADTGLAAGYHLTGGVRPARNQDRIDEYRHFESLARSLGFDVGLIGVDALRNLHPLLDTRDYIGALHDPMEGNVDPAQLTQSYARGARDRGARIYRKRPVTGLSRKAGGAWRVETTAGTIECEILVNAGGLWGREVGALSGLQVPMVPMQHHYLVTRSVPELADLDRSLPLFRDGEESFYLRQERDGLIVGPYESRPATWAASGTPSDFGMELLPPELDRIGDTLELAMARVPAIARVGIHTIVNGGITFAADGQPLIGPPFGVENYYLLTGFTAGIMESGGAGKCLAEWIVEGRPPYDMFAFDPRRFGDFADHDYVVARAAEIYPKTYAIVYPHEELMSGRGKRQSPIHDRLSRVGAVWGSRFGWERPNWFAPGGIPARDELGFRRTNWFAQVGDECKAMSRSCGVIDLTTFAKFEVSGANATRYLDRVTTNRLPTRVGQIRLTYCLNPSGGIECEFTVTRTGPQRFYLTGAAIARLHHLDWLLRQRAHDETVVVEDVTDRYGILVVAGPRSREVLSALTVASLDNEQFPWTRGRHIAVAGHELWALRWNYTGELGWELHHDLAHQCTIYDAVMRAGEVHGIRNVGIRALEPLRIEKGYAAWAMELTPEFTPLEAGVGRFVRMDKGDFTGREALIGMQETAIRKRLVMLRIDARDCDAMGNEPVFRGETFIGLTTSGAFGHRIGASLAFAYIDATQAEAGSKVEVVLLGDRLSACILSAPPFDSGNSRLRA